MWYALAKMFVRFFIAFALFLGIGPLAHKATDGFALQNIQPAPFSHDALAPALTDEAKALLNQTFTYFAKGGQCYVFLGDDGTTLLKVFKFQHMRVPFLVDFSGLYEKKRERKRAVFLEAIHSTALAMRRLKSETGLLGVHLGPSSDLPKRLTLVDKLGINHTVNPKELYFILQERAMPLSTDLRVARLAMDLVESLSKKGIVDKDPNFETNFGLLDGRVIQFDVGRFVDEGGGIKKHEVAKLFESIQSYFQRYSEENFEAVRQEIDARLKNI